MEVKMKPRDFYMLIIKKKKRKDIRKALKKYREEQDRIEEQLIEMFKKST